MSQIYIMYHLLCSLLPTTCLVLFLSGMPKAKADVDMCPVCTLAACRVYSMHGCFFCGSLLYRDIPMPLVTSGVDHGNLRELALARMKDHGTHVSMNISIMNNCCTVPCVYISFFAECKLEGSASREGLSTHPFPFPVGASHHYCFCFLHHMHIAFSHTFT